MSEAIIIPRHSLKWAQAGNSIGARLVSLGTWNQLRVGILWSVRQDASANITTDFALGLCSGTSAVYGDASATHFAGITSNPADTWSISGGFLINADIRPTKQVGVTKTNGTVLATDHMVNAQTVNNYRSVTFFQVDKGSPNYTFFLFYRNAAGAADYTVADLAAVMEAGAPALANHTGTSGQTLAVDEGVDGVFDAVQFYWNLTTSNAEIDAFMVSKIS